MLEIYLIRHGECAGNRENRFRGRHDFPLNENGIEQAHALQMELKNIEWKEIYSSPLSRATVTASIISAGKIKVKIDEGFNNIALGNWENKLKSEIEAQYPDLWSTWLSQPEKLSFPGLESLQQVRNRSYQTLMDIIKITEAGIIAIISHRAVFKPLLAAILDIGEPYFWKLQMDTAAYSVVEYREDRGFTLTCMNQTKHLGQLVREDLG